MVKTQDKRSEFKLRLAGVASGKHTFSIICDKSFFEINEISELLDGAINLQINMDKSDKMLNLEFVFKGNVVVECARCLDPVTYDLDFTDHLIVNLLPDFSNINESEDEQVWMINEKEFELDIYQFVYESIILSLPSQIIHPDDKKGKSTCNPEFLKKLAQYSVVEKQMPEEEIDPRWEALKNLKFED